MRLLIHGINYHPELTGVGKYTGEMAEWLAARGHEVRVVTAPPYYPSWKIAQGYSGRSYTRERINGIEIFRCPVWVPERPSGLKRLIHLMSFAAAALPVMVRQSAWRPDIVIVVEPTFFCVPAAILTSRVAHSRTWLHVQDLELDAAFELGMVKGNVLRRFVGAVEERTLRRMDRVSSISKQMAHRLLVKGVDAPRLAYFPNWVDTEQIKPMRGLNHLREELGIEPGDVVVLASGNMGAKQGLELLLDVARRLDGDSRIRFLLSGDGVARADLQKMAREQGADNVSFLPLQPLDRLSELLSLADIHVMAQKSRASDLVMPSRLTGMFASGRPVVVTADAGTAVADVVSDAGGGLIVSPESPGDLAQAIQELAADEFSRARLGRNARRYAEEHMAKEDILLGLESRLFDLALAPEPIAEEEPEEIRRAA